MPHPPAPTKPRTRSRGRPGTESFSSKQMAKFRRVMDEFGKRKLRSSSGELVTDVAQARAIAFSEARKIA